MWLAPAAVLALAGCGGSSALSKAELVKKANAVCTSTVQDLGALGPPADFSTNPAAAATYLDKIVPIIKKAVDDLKALKPPSDLEGDWGSFTKALEQEDKLYESAQAKAHAKDATGVDDLAKTRDIRDSTTHPAEQKLGLTDCHG